MFGFLSTLLAFVGLIGFLNLSIVYWLIFGPIVFLFLINLLTRYLTQSLYPGFSKRMHLNFINDYWNNISIAPSVDVFITYAGEDILIYNAPNGCFDTLAIACINTNIVKDTLYFLGVPLLTAGRALRTRFFYPEKNRDKKELIPNKSMKNNADYLSRFRSFRTG